MERLTRVYDCETPKRISVTKGKSPQTWRENTAVGKALLRLAAYEDTGLGPDEITTEPYGCAFYCNRKCNLDGDWCAEGPGCPYEIKAETAKHLLEFAQAEKDGRLVVLPCKVGDTVYVTYGEGYRPHVVDRMYIFANNQVQVRMRHSCTETLWLSAAFGKTVFLTREEAEAALKEREEG